MLSNIASLPGPLYLEHGVRAYIGMRLLVCVCAHELEICVTRPMDEMVMCGEHVHIVRCLTGGDNTHRKIIVRW